MKKSLVLSSLAAIPLLMAACSSTQTKHDTAADKNAAAEKNLCMNMNEVESSIREYPAVSEWTPLDSIREANARVDQAVLGIKEAAKEVNNPGVLEVQAAYQDLQNTVNEVPGGRTTVGEASDSLRVQAKELKDAWDRLYMSMECGA